MLGGQVVDGVDVVQAVQGAERFILDLGHTSEEKRITTLRAFQLAEYECWLPRRLSMSSAVCIKVWLLLRYGNVCLPSRHDRC